MNATGAGTNTVGEVAALGVDGGASVGGTAGSPPDVDVGVACVDRRSTCGVGVVAD